MWKARRIAKWEGVQQTYTLSELFSEAKRQLAMVRHQTETKVAVLDEKGLKEWYSKKRSNYGD
jgi:hypothetical protein